MEEKIQTNVDLTKGTLSLVLKHPDDGVWRDDASCKKMGNTQFFESLHNRSKEVAQRLLEVKELCASCPVNKDCLDFAVKNEIKYGIWGGMTPQERTQAFPQVSVMGQRRKPR